MTRLLRKGIEFEWNTDCQSAFDTTRANLLAAFQEGGDSMNFENPGAPNEIQFISFASKTLDDTQRRWVTGEREMYAIVWACETFERYIKGIPTVVYTDHQNLQWPSINKSGKILRWALRLQEFNITIKYLAGELNVVADWLSRSNPSDETLPENALVPVSYNALHESNIIPTLKELSTAAKAESPSQLHNLTWTSDGAARWKSTGQLYCPVKF